MGADKSIIGLSFLLTLVTFTQFLHYSSWVCSMLFLCFCKLRWLNTMEVCYSLKKQSHAGIQVGALSPREDSGIQAGHRPKPDFTVIDSVPSTFPGRYFHVFIQRKRYWIPEIVLRAEGPTTQHRTWMLNLVLPLNPVSILCLELLNLNILYYFAISLY